MNKEKLPTRFLCDVPAVLASVDAAKAKSASNASRKKRKYTKKSDHLDRFFCHQRALTFSGFTVALERVTSALNQASIHYQVVINGQPVRCNSLCAACDFLNGFIAGNAFASGDVANDKLAGVNEGVKLIGVK